jgi:hypothetical protein
MWENSTLTMLEETPATVTPSLLLDAILGAIVSEDLEGLLKRLTGRDGDGDVDPSSRR